MTDQGEKKRKTVRFNLKLKQPNILRQSDSWVQMSGAEQSGEQGGRQGAAWAGSLHVGHFTGSTDGDTDVQEEQLLAPLRCN